MVLSGKLLDAANKHACVCPLELIALSRHFTSMVKVLVHLLPPPPGPLTVR